MPLGVGAEPGNAGSPAISRTDVGAAETADVFSFDANAVAQGSRVHSTGEKTSPCLAGRIFVQLTGKCT